jgi:hypothetical protein
MGQRDRGGRFVPGSSGNPAGRPVTVGLVRPLLRGRDLQSLIALVDLMRDESAPLLARVAAQGELLRRGQGRASAGELVDRLDLLDDAEIEALTPEPD